MEDKKKVPRKKTPKTTTPKKVTPKKIPPELSPEEQEIVDDRKQLFTFVFTDIMGYTTGMKEGKSMALRLEGLHNGTFMANKTQKPKASYSYKIIYYTFVLMKKDIQYRLSTMDFKDENHKFNYIMVIIESKINDICMAIQKNKKTEEALNRQTPTVIVVEPVHKFVKAEEPKSAKMFDDDMW